MHDTSEDQSSVLWETPTHRLRLVDDPIPAMPENMGGCPVFHVEHPRNYYWEELDDSAVKLVYGTGAMHLSSAEFNLFDHLEGLRRTLIEQLRANGSRLPDDRSLFSQFERTIKMEHDGSIKVYGPNQMTDDAYIAINTSALREYWIGSADRSMIDEAELARADLDEIQAWLEGDVHGLVLEKRFDVHETSNATDPVTGHTVTTSRSYVRWDVIEMRYGFYGTDAYQCEADSLATLYSANAALQTG